MFVTFVDTYNVKFAKDSSLLFASCLCFENLLMRGNIILLHGWLEGVDELLKCFFLVVSMLDLIRKLKVERLRPGLNVAFYMRRIQLSNYVHVKCDV